MTFRTRLRVRKLVDDPRINTLRQQLATARRAHKSTVRLEDEIKRIRMTRLREQFGEAVSVSVLFVGGFVAYCLVNPLPVFA